MNILGGTGTEVYWHTKGTAEDKKVASIVAPKLASQCGMKNRGVKTAAFAVLTCNATAILIEGGFMDTVSDYEIITSENGQQKYAQAVADSIIEYLGLTKVASSQPSTNTSSSQGFKVGDKVKVKTTATHYATGQVMASFVKGSTYEVTKVDGNKLLLSNISSWVWNYDVEKVGSVSVAKPFAIGEYNAYVVTTDNLNIRSKRNASSSLVGTLPKGIRVEVKYILGVDDGHTEPFWGSVYTSYGNGFINLNYTQPTI